MLVTKVTNATITTHASEPSPPYKSGAIDLEGVALAVLLPVAVDVGEAMADIEESEADAVVGRLESAASVVYTADRPVTLEQILGAVIVSATKFTAAHCQSMILALKLQKSGRSITDLKQDPIRRILYHLDDTFLASKGSWHSDVPLTEIPQPGLLNSRQ